MDRIKEIDHELDLIDARLGVLNQYYDDSANHKLHFSELCDTLRGVINQVRNDRNELEQEKKAIIEREKWSECNQYTQWYKDHEPKVIAWMMLPDPYKK